MNLVSAAAGGRLERSAATVADAWLAWSVLAEPGDEAAGALVHLWGPQAALTWLAQALADPVAATHALAPELQPRDVDTLVRASERWGRRAADLDVDAVRQRSEQCGARIVLRGDPQWPHAVDDLGVAAPFVLWVRGDGDLRVLGSQAVALVGARSCTAYGDHMAAQLAADLAQAGRVVVSGGAYGIDAAAHRGALAAGGQSLAVMAGGVDRLYPVGNSDLLARTMRSGLVVSEVPPGWAPHRSRFLSRNRVIACAAATVVVEAAHRSGALNTVGHAQRLMRPVAAVPGPATSASSVGCHRLVRDQEAVLVTCAAEVIELTGPLEIAAVVQPDVDTGRLDFARPEDRAAFDALGRRSLLEGDIAVTAGLTAPQVRAALGRMEATGLVERDRGGWRRRSGASLI
ncbi:DNA-processing protein DprA [Demequina sp.]|uniref:DNA-processing protein DprA n=1 Tax=Demequina sp. TaxID=2050685 RepID=UPI003A8C1AC1